MHCACSLKGIIKKEKKRKKQERNASEKVEGEGRGEGVERMGVARQCARVYLRCGGAKLGGGGGEERGKPKPKQTNK